MICAVALTACGTGAPFKIKNDTRSTVTLVSCAQDPGINRRLAPGSAFTFNDDVGTRVLSDDPGFACFLTTPLGSGLCLALPSDQNTLTTFRVSEALPSASVSGCFSRSDPHI